MDSHVARLQARADRFLFQPFLEIYTTSHFSFQIVFLTLKLRNRLIFPFNLSIRFSNAVGFLKLAPNREYPTQIRMLSRSFILPEGCEGAQCVRRRPSKKTGGIRVLEPNGGVVRIATHREVHSPQSTGKRGKRRLATKRRSSFSTNLGLCRAPSEVQLRIRGRFV